MRPPTRSTRSARPTSRKASVNARGNRGTSNPSAPSQVNDEPKTGSVAATIDVQVNPSTLSGLDSAPASMPIVGCFPAWPRTTFVLENEKVASMLAFSPNARAMSGKPTRSRRRMTTDKVEALDAFFRHNTHPSRKEKESICKNLDIDLKTVTIWFQNKRQTAARSRKQLESESAPTAAAMDMLASASATMASLSAMSSVPAMRFVGFDSERSCVNCLSLDPLAPQPLHASLRADYLSSSKLQPLTPLRMPLSAVVQDPNISVPPWFSVSTCLSSLSPELGMPRHNRPIHPEDLWKHIPSSPTQSALSSPDVSTDIDTPDGSMGFRFSDHARLNGPVHGLPSADARTRTFFAKTGRLAPSAAL
ncbi:hypothetical protein B0F90DRAFT_1665033 [Multifurca ochricompacta]|uniref:Homeobox domain-containing protein n=1 Tax=Multifurca ochricompacta TaxID=376703 RepID=A0AAD4MEU1_9AGAM|nr:hypothetical protein B0F90DRAFT_1665033 [Multifurca ochricompacta]